MDEELNEKNIIEETGVGSEEESKEEEEIYVPCVSQECRFSAFEMTQYILRALDLEDESKTTNKQTFKMYGYGGSLNDLFLIVEDLAINDGKIEKVMDVRRSAWGIGEVRKICGDGTNLNNKEINLFMERVFYLLYQMVLAPGNAYDISTSLPWIHVTEYGLKCIAEREILPYDSDGYLKRIKACSKHDDWDIHYLSQSLKCFNVGVYDAAMMILGVEGEYLANRIIERYLVFLDKNEASEKSALETALMSCTGKISSRYQEYCNSLSRVKNIKDASGNPKYPDLKALSPRMDSAGHSAFMNYLRLTRNELAHPSSAIMEPSETMLMIVSFLKYFEIQNKFLEYYESNA